MEAQGSVTEHVRARWHGGRRSPGGCHVGDPPSQRTRSARGPAGPTSSNSRGVYRVRARRTHSECCPTRASGLNIPHLNREDDKRGGLRIDGEIPGDPTSPEIYRCLVRNIGTVPVEEVRLHFTAAFFPGVKPEGGSQRAQFYTISIPPLGAGEGFALYIRNDSPVGVIINIPLEAEVRQTPAGGTLNLALKSDIQNLPWPSSAGSGMLTFDGARPAKGMP